MKLKITTLLLLLTSAFTLSNWTVRADKYTEIEEGRIVNLYDAFGKNESLIQDFGFSCITKYKGKTILFDAGTNADIFKENVNKLNIDLRQVDIAVVSHGHADHLNGMDYLLQVNPEVKIYFPYDIFWGAPIPFDASGREPQINDSLPSHMLYFHGDKQKFTIDQSGRYWNADVEYVRSSKEIAPGLNLITTLSPYMGYFSCYPGKSFVEGHFEQSSDNCSRVNLPELSLSMKTEKGEILIVGCSHSGVEQIVSETKKFTNNNIDLVYGGFHMIPFDRSQILQYGRLLKDDLKVRRIAPAHCTGHLAFKMLMDIYREDYLFAGLGEIVYY
jgi:7,8-dihydropterin-6-yl-methyl-4-(beta-D-ribofuranosyl)aminobenzene 5'-phosphate synthase